MHLASFGAALLVCLAQALPSSNDLAPLLFNPNTEIYIIVLKPELSSEQLVQHHLWLNLLVPPTVSSSSSSNKKHGVHSVFEIQQDFKGYIGSFHENEIDFIRASPAVQYVEKDQIVYAYKNATSEVERDAPWGLARVAHRQHPDDVESHHYSYDSDAGQDVVVYVVDTGVNIKHQEFQGRATWGKTIPEGDEDADGNGHGTHVAGTIAGKTFGIAKSAKIVAVKVLRSNGSGTMSDVVRGIEWVARAHKERLREYEADKKKKRPGKDPKKVKSAANMSLGGGRSRALDMAVNAVVEAGVHFAVAAGNDDRDACSYSPAAAENAVTVGATTIEDSRAWFSNWGKCVDIFAPGHQILSAWIGSSTATNTISGTSMASPHIAGIMASYLSRPDWENLTPLELKQKLIEEGTANVIKMGVIPPYAKTPNVLVFTNPPKHDDLKENEL